MTSGTTTNLYVSHSNGAYFTQVTNLGSNREVTDVVWSPDGSQLAYLADANRDNKYELFRTTAAFDSSTSISATNVLISGTIDSSTALDIASPTWSPDGNKLAYLVTDSRLTTFVNKAVGLNYHDIRIGGRHSVRLSLPFASYQDLSRYVWSPDGMRLAYLSNPANDGRYNVHQINFASASFLYPLR